MAGVQNYTDRRSDRDHPYNRRTPSVTLALSGAAHLSEPPLTGHFGDALYSRGARREHTRSKALARYRANDRATRLHTLRVRRAVLDRSRRAWGLRHSIALTPPHSRGWDDELRARDFSCLSRGGAHKSSRLTWDWAALKFRRVCRVVEWIGAFGIGRMP